MIGIDPVQLSARLINCHLRELTHCNYYTEEATDYPLDQIVNLLIRRLWSVQSPVCFFAHT